MSICGGYNHKCGVFCGKRTGKTVQITGNNVVIKFHSDSLYEETGFLLLLTTFPLGKLKIAQMHSNQENIY